jgi:hypothetical protein
MKIKKILFIAFIVIATSLFSGCLVQNKPEQKPKEITINDLCINVDDLSEKYIQYYSGFLYLSEFSNQANESIVKWFTRGYPSNLTESGLITCEINRFNNTDDAILIYKQTNDFLISERNFTIINDSINMIGDESKDLEKKGFTDLLTFRLSNYIVVMSTEDYSYTFELAKIVEQRIKNIL